MRLFLRIFSTVAIIAILGFTFTQRSYLLGMYHANQSVKKMSEKMNYEALSEAITALRYGPLISLLHLNLGDLYLNNKDYERALKEFGTSTRVQGQNEDSKLMGFFNSGVTATAMKNVDQALSFYQNALGEKNDSVETKTNIELLVQSQSGKGDGDGDNNSDSKSDSKDDKGKDNKNDPNRKAQNDPPKNQPQPYKGKEISKENVNKILDELKQQEQNVRAKFENRNVHASKNEKDW